MKWLDFVFPIVAFVFLLFVDWYQSLFGIFAAIAITLVAAMAIANAVLRFTRKRRSKKKTKED